MSYGIIEPEAFTSKMALLKITSAEETEGKFEDTPLQTAFEVEVLSYEEQGEDDAARIGHKFQDWASFKKDTRTGGIGIAYGGKLWNLTRLRATVQKTPKFTNRPMRGHSRSTCRASRQVRIGTVLNLLRCWSSAT